MSDATRTRMLLASIALVVCLAGWLHWHVLGRQQSRLDALRQQSQLIQLQVSQADLPRQIDALKLALQSQDAALPTRAEVTQVLQALTHDLTALGVTELTAITAPTLQVGTIQQIPVGVTFRGTFGSVFEILRRTQDYPRLIRMERLVIRRDPDAPLDGLQVTLRFDAFAQYPQESR